MQMAQQYSDDPDEAELARHECVSTSEPVSSSSGGEPSWPRSIAPASSGFLSVGRVSCVLRVRVAWEGRDLTSGDDLRGKGAEADRGRMGSTACVGCVGVVRSPQSSSVCLEIQLYTQTSPVHPSAFPAVTRARNQRVTVTDV